MDTKKWKVIGDSTADTVATHTVAAPTDVDRRLLIHGYFAVIRGAVTDVDASVLIADSDAGAIWGDWFGVAAAIGTRLGIVFGTDQHSGLEVPHGLGITLKTIAGGTGNIQTIGMWGIEV